ncbi:hypothetical protein BKA70DRAFT_1447133 [Coprinopsis sp. MPI-PUGE-AT-0042]|nr:hypothetical protein BKA70DRAFT_1447133 [Coprinopsis sp. MPI-PUGE-AT-0042]
MPPAQPRVSRPSSVSSDSEDDACGEAESSIQGDAADVDPQHQRLVDRCRSAVSSTDFGLMKRALKDAQITVNNYYNEIQRLKGEVSHLKAALTTVAAISRRQRSKKKNEEDDVIREVLPTDVDDLAAAILEQSKRSAQIYVLFWCYFTSDSLMGHCKPRIAWENVEERFASDKSRKQGYIAELFECVPELYHDYVTLKRKPFPQLFLKYAGNTRLNTASRARSAAAQIFVELRSIFDDARNKLKAQGKWPTDWKAQRIHTFHQDLFDIDFDRNLEFKQWCKILYAEFRDDLPSGLFKNEALIQLALVLIHGPKAVNGSPSACKFRKGSPLAKIEPTTSAGLIALCAILVRFLLTADKEFPNSSVGAQSKIDWPQEFMKYKRYLMTSWNDETTKDLVSFWNRWVFPNAAASLDLEFQVTGDGPNVVGEDDEADIATMRRAAEEERLAREQASGQSHSGSAPRTPATLDNWYSQAGPSPSQAPSQQPEIMDELDLTVEPEIEIIDQGIQETGHIPVMFEIDGEEDDEDDEESPPGASVLPSFLTAKSAVHLPAVRSLANQAEASIITSTTSFSPAKVSLPKRTIAPTKTPQLPLPTFQPLPPPAQKTKRLQEVRYNTKNGVKIVQMLVTNDEDSDDSNTTATNPLAPPLLAPVGKQRPGRAVEFEEDVQVLSKPLPPPVAQQLSSSKQAQLQEPKNPEPLASSSETPAPAPSKVSKAAKKGSSKGKGKGGAPDVPLDNGAIQEPEAEAPAQEPAQCRKATSSKPPITQGATTHSGSRCQGGS